MISDEVIRKSKNEKWTTSNLNTTFLKPLLMNVKMKKISNE